MRANGYTDKKQYYHVQFGDILFYNWLVKIGLCPNKSKVMGKIDVPDQYFRDFLRGHFDGDGTCYSYWDPRWKSSFMFYVKFISASRNHIDWLQERIQQLFKIKGHISFPKTQRTGQLCYAKRESSILISKMYHEKNVPCLKRKSNKIAGILKIAYQEEFSQDADVAELARRATLRG